MKSKFLSLTNLLIVLSVIAAWTIVATQIKPFLFYHFQQIGFNFGFDFLHDFLNYPGGISDYLAVFVSQYFALNTVGALLYVAFVAIQGVMMLDILKRVSAKSVFNFLFFGIILLSGVLVLCDYHYPFYISIRLLMAFSFTWLFVVVNEKTPNRSPLVWGMMALLLFYLASGPALIIFGISSALVFAHTQPARRWIIVAPVFIAASVFIPFLAFKTIFPSVLANLYRIVENRPPKMLAYNAFYPVLVYYLLLPLIILAGFLFNKKSNEKDQETYNKTKKQKVKTPFVQKAPVVMGGHVILLVAVGYFLFLKSFDPFKRELIYIDYYADQEQWPEILKLAESIHDYDFRVNYQVNRALAHLGKLPDQLFDYPQLLGSNGLFLDTSNLNGSFTMPLSDLYFDLGFMSESLHWAFEAQTLIPNSPRILKRIVEIYLINGKYDRAEAFLRVLGKNKLCTDWVSKYEKYVTDTSLAAKDPVMAEKRLFSPHAEVVNSGPIANLGLLLETNKDNRMAYDYMMSLCILDSHLSEFVKYAQNYSHYKIKTLPRAWEEAMSLYILKTKTFPPFVTQETISKECLKRLAQFNGTMKNYHNNKEAAKAEMWKNFGHTYWYYLIYQSPKVTNILNKKSVIQ